MRYISRFQAALFSMILFVTPARTFEDIRRQQQQNPLRPRLVAKFSNNLKNSEQLHMLSFKGSLDEIIDQEESFADEGLDSQLDREPQELSGQRRLPTASIIPELQEAAIGALNNSGHWGMKFVLIDAQGREHLLSEFNSHMPLKPASTNKVFSGYYDFKNYADPKLKTDPDNHQSEFINQLAAMLHVSHNQMADGLLLSSADSKNIKIATSKMKSFYSDLEDIDLYTPADGSGLSYANKITASLEVSLLQKILKDGQYDKFKHLMAHPLSTDCEHDLNSLKYQKQFCEKNKKEFRGCKLHGYHSTLDKSFPNFSGKVYAKTGTLKKTKGLSGFVEIKNGETIVFSIVGDFLKVSTGIAFSKIKSIVELHAKFAEERNQNVEQNAAVNGQQNAATSESGTTPAPVNNRPNEEDEEDE